MWVTSSRTNVSPPFTSIPEPTRCTPHAEKSHQPRPSPPSPPLLFQSLAACRELQQVKRTSRYGNRPTAEQRTF